MGRRLNVVAACLAALSILVAIALVISIMGGLNGVIPERDSPALLRTMVLLLLLNTLVLAWTVFMRRRRA